VADAERRAEPAGAGRKITTFQLLALGVNGIVGVGIFFAPATAARSAPSLGSVLVFAATGLALLPVALAFAALGRRFDEDGGPVVFARAAFGDRVSFLVGWVAYVSAVLSSSAVIVGLTGAVAPAVGLEGSVEQRLAAAVLAAALALFVASGISISARAWTGLTVLKLLPLLALLGAFLLFGGGGGTPAPSLGPPRVSWLGASLTVLFAYQGFEVVPVVAGQVRASARSVPLATVASLLVAVLLYVGLAWACVRALPDLASSSAPLAEAAAAFGGAGLGRLVVAGTSVSALGICLGMMVTTPRYLSSLASGGRDLFGLSSIAVLLQYAVTSASLLVLARRRERGLGPRDAWPAVPTLLLGLLLVAFGATREELLVAGVAVALGLLLLALGRPRGTAPLR
jgi:APA family basic amino acid/polyamine antiporter